MHKSGARAFWLSFFLTLAILIPLLGGFVLYSGWQGKQNEAQQAQKSQSGVPIGQTGAGTDLTVLITVAAEQPAFVLVRLNAPAAAITISPVPAESVLLAPAGTVLLADSYTSAGPARAAALLAGTLNIQIDHYLAATPAALGRIWGQLEPPRVNLTGQLDQETLNQLGLTADPVLSLAPEEATTFIDSLGLAPARTARIRAAVWDAALRQQLENLSAALPAGLRKNSGSLLTDLTATDYYTLENVLSWLAKKKAEVQAEQVPGRFDQQAGRYEFGEDSIAFAKKQFVPAEGGRDAPVVYATPRPVTDPLKSEQGQSPSPTPGEPPAAEATPQVQNAAGAAQGGENGAERQSTPTPGGEGASTGPTPNPTPSLPPAPAAPAGSLE